MEEIEKYVAELNRMWHFVEQFTDLVTNLFPIKHSYVNACENVPGVLECLFDVNHADHILPVPVLERLAAPLLSFSVPVRFSQWTLTDVDFDESLGAYPVYYGFTLHIDYASDLYACPETE